MSPFQPREDPGLGVIPTVEVTDYDDSTSVLREEEDSFEDTVSPPRRHALQPPLSPPSRASTPGRQRRSRSETTPTVGSDREEEDGRSSVSGRSSRMSPSRSPKKSPSRGRSSPSGKSKYKTDDWNEVTEPEERRRIQNRIAQRKFRDKKREEKERAQRDAQNQEYAGSSYRVPSSDELVADEGLSGLPWGSLNMRYAVAKGHESSSSQHDGSRRASDHRPEDALSSPPPQFLSPQTATFPPPPPPSHLGGFYAGDGSGIGDDGSRYYDDQAYYYDYGTDPTHSL